MFIEDASRANAVIGAPFGSESARSLPGSSNHNPFTNPSGSPANPRRVNAWADPDAATNGLSGAPQGADRGKKVFNQSASPVGGPQGATGCPWTLNNCGPNDEPFAFHTGIVLAVMGDGSVRTFRDSIDPLSAKAFATASGGEVNAAD